MVKAVPIRVISDPRAIGTRQYPAFRSELPSQRQAEAEIKSPTDDPFRRLVGRGLRVLLVRGAP